MREPPRFKERANTLQCAVTEGEHTSCALTFSLLIFCLIKEPLCDDEIGNDTNAYGVKKKRRPVDIDLCFVCIEGRKKDQDVASQKSKEICGSLMVGVISPEERREKQKQA